MYQTIHETISVSGIFQNFSFIPQEFSWKSKNFTIEKITSTHELLDGGVKKRRYAVSCQGNLYLLEYNRQKESWVLEQIWCEG